MESKTKNVESKTEECGVQNSSFTSKNQLLGLCVQFVHEIFDSQENHYNCCHQMLDFKAKMHQHPIRPQTSLGELTALPQAPYS